ncbi:hypothetical protein K443DRAFT_679414 [Laccaria amethystina LaAM-08-1]|jgi:plastocyanin|uniref:Cupredoxin n=1 Tax=Laccaria amethystina LaAM-08-1 TaxID=1095629 RepID=A0A0C9XR24_9AGAR|nr:hypothetical protein K443DRAFT_679414 [Laccaria amethystina LaAM-08-1]
MYRHTLGLALASLPVALAATYNVEVGAGGQLAYDPPYITASAGDTVNFIFNPKNHTVTQSSFNTPCVSSNGFKTGFVPVSANTSSADLPVKQFTVPAGTAPLWFYCGQTGHCGQGMVFAINAPADPDPHSFSAFQKLAIATNGTGSSTHATTSAFSTPPPQHWQTATATVTAGGSTWTTTYTSYDGTPPPTPAAQPVDHKITVGADGLLAYNPPNITASIGDTVTFEFHPKNHTVTQSSFSDPCHAVVKSDGSSGFKSGFTPVAANATSFPTFQIKINDTAPIWGYCGQTGHCQQGMVFAINAVESSANNFEAFLEIAKNSGNSTSTGTATSSSTTSTSTDKSGALGLQFSPRFSLVALVIGVFSAALL